jgi:hypothetical protein
MFHLPGRGRRMRARPGRFAPFRVPRYCVNGDSIFVTKFDAVTVQKWFPIGSFGRVHVVWFVFRTRAHVRMGYLRSVV